MPVKKSFSTCSLIAFLLLFRISTAGAYQYRCHDAGLFPNPNGDCTRFVSCNTAHLGWDMNCPEGLFFNPHLLVCDWPQNVPSCVRTTQSSQQQRCPDAGLFPNPDGDCTRFVSCNTAGQGWDMDCPEGLLFNPNMLICDWPRNVPDCRPLPHAPTTTEAPHQPSLTLPPYPGAPNSGEEHYDWGLVNRRDETEPETSVETFPPFPGFDSTEE